MLRGRGDAALPRSPGALGAFASLGLTLLMRTVASGGWNPALGPLGSFIVTRTILVQGLFLALFVGMLSGIVPSLRRGAPQRRRDAARSVLVRAAAALPLGNLAARRAAHGAHGRRDRAGGARHHAVRRRWSRACERTLVTTGRSRQPGRDAQGRDQRRLERAAARGLPGVRFFEGIARDADGEPLASPELVVQPFFQTRDGGRENVLVRGVEPIALAVHDDVQIVEGRMFTPSSGEVIVGRGVAGRYARARRSARAAASGAAPGRWWASSRAAAPRSRARSGCDVRELANDAKRPVPYSGLRVRVAPGADMDALARRIGDDPRWALEATPETRVLREAGGVRRTRSTDLVVALARARREPARSSARPTRSTPRVQARTAEIGTLRALGFSRAHDPRLVPDRVARWWRCAASRWAARSPGVLAPRAVVHRSAASAFAAADLHDQRDPAAGRRRAISRWPSVLSLVIGLRRRARSRRCAPRACARRSAAEGVSPWRPDPIALGARRALGAAHRSQPATAARRGRRWLKPRARGRERAAARCSPASSAGAPRSGARRA